MATTSLPSTSNLLGARRAEAPSWIGKEPERIDGIGPVRMRCQDIGRMQQSWLGKDSCFVEGYTGQSWEECREPVEQGRICQSRMAVEGIAEPASPSGVPHHQRQQEFAQVAQRGSPEAKEWPAW